MAVTTTENKASFKKWRYILIANCFSGYCIYYVTRKSCTYSVPLLLQDSSLSLTSETIGLMFSVQMLFYSIGKFLCGILSDRYSCRTMFAVGLLFTGLSNVGFGVCDRNYQFVLLWGVNGLFQGCGWAPIAVLLKRWYLPAEIGKMWSFMSVTMNVSSSMIPLIMVTLAHYCGWRLSFVIVGFTASAFSSVALLLVKDFPGDIAGGQENPDGPNHNSNSKSRPTQEKALETSMRIFLNLLSSKFFCYISLSYFLWTCVKQGLEDWLLIYLTRTRSYTGYDGSISIMCFQFGGIACLLTSGVLSDILVAKLSSKMRSSPRVIVVLSCSVFILPWLYVIQSSDVTAPVIVNIGCFFLGLCCYGPHTLYGLLVIENSPPGLSGTAHGIAATFSTVGSVFSGYPLSYIISQYEWHAMFVVLAGLAVVNSVLLIFSMTVSCGINDKKEQ